MSWSCSLGPGPQAARSPRDPWTPEPCPGAMGHTDQKGESQATTVVHRDKCHDRRMYREGNNTQR